MIKRTIEISQNPAHLSVKLNQLLIQGHDQPVESHASIPCEDIGILLVDHQRNTYSHTVLSQLAEHGGVMVVCGRNHMPTSMLLPLSDHSQVIWRINDQIAISKPLQKQLWKQLVQAKIRGQAANLEHDSKQRNKLESIARQVRSGDASNGEAHAAKLYWQSWLGLNQPFKRAQDRKASPPNNLLNYGYAALRATIARSIVAAGLMPMLGLHHSNRSNAFCLADDLIEPYRPMVDRRARELFTQGLSELTQTTKAGLLQLLAEPVCLDGEKGPLMVCIQKMVSSLVKCYEGERNTLAIPIMPHQHHEAN